MVDSLNYNRKLIKQLSEVPAARAKNLCVKTLTSFHRKVSGLREGTTRYCVLLSLYTTYLVEYVHGPAGGPCDFLTSEATVVGDVRAILLDTFCWKPTG